MTQNGNGHTNEERRPVTIIILTWNGLQYTKSCLDSLISKTPANSYRLIVVDNGSSDGTVEYLRGRSDLKAIFNESNLGFARANNLAILESDPDSDILLLNNDTLILDENWLHRLQQTAYRENNAGIVGCRLLRPNGTLQHVGTYVPIDTLWGQQIGGGEKDINQYPGTREVEGVVFACVYVRRDVIQTIGLLEEEYFSYFEDTDYCLRAREAGFRALCCGSVRVLHHENVSTRINGVAHSTVFDKAQAVFRKRWLPRLEKTRYSRQIGWQSLLNFPTGYAISSRELALALDLRGVRVSYKYVYGPGTVFPKDEPELSDSYMTNVIRGRSLLDPSIPQIVYAQGDVFQSNFGEYKVGFTMLETDRIPTEWVRQANMMDEVWCPSTFNVRTFRESGVTRPVNVIPLGVDPEYFHQAISSHRLTDRYTFLSIFEWGERKAPEVLLRAFNSEFRAGEPVVLVCKVINVDPGVDVQDQVRRLELDPVGGRIHISLNQVIPTYQLGQLYGSADCFVLPTRGEGWGMPVIEAMACGLPVIATNWSAHCDFMNEGNAYPLSVERLIPAAAKCPYYDGFRWADPSFTELRRLMRNVFENQGEARAKGERAARDISANWTWDHAAQKIIARLDDIANIRTGSKSQQPPGMLGDNLL